MTKMAQKYNEEIVPVLQKQFGYSSRMAVPKVAKVVVNMGVGEAVSDPKLLDQAVEELGSIVGQRPAIRRAKKSISNFKLREGMPIGRRHSTASGCTSFSIGCSTSHYPAYGTSAACRPRPSMAVGITRWESEST